MRPADRRGDIIGLKDGIIPSHSLLVILEAREVVRLPDVQEYSYSGYNPAHNQRKQVNGGQYTLQHRGAATSTHCICTC